MKYVKLLMGVSFFFYPLSYVMGANKNLSTPKQTEHLPPKQEQEPLTPQQVQQMLPAGCCGCWYYRLFTNWLYANCINPSYPKYSSTQCVSSKVEYLECYKIGLDSGTGMLQCNQQDGQSSDGLTASNGAEECGPPEECNNVCYFPAGTTYPPPSSSNTSKSHLGPIQTKSLQNKS